MSLFPPPPPRCSSARWRCRRSRNRRRRCRFCRRLRRERAPDMRVRSGVASLVAVSLAWLLMPAPAPRAQETPILAAMQDELQRSLAGLRLQDAPPPYYIAYEMDDMVDTSVLARLGAIVDDASRRIRVLDVEVRVGDYSFDSSRFISGTRGSGFSGGRNVAPLDDDYDALRREL